MAAITLVLLAMGTLVAVGTTVVYLLLRLIGNLSEAKETERREKRGEAPRR